MSPGPNVYRPAGGDVLPLAGRYPPVYLFIRGLLELQMYGRMYNPVIARYHPRVRRNLAGSRGEILASRWLHEPQPNQQSDGGVRFFHTLRSDIDRGDVCFRSRVVRVVAV